MRKFMLIAGISCMLIPLFSFTSGNEFFMRILADKHVTSPLQEVELNNADIEKYSGTLENFIAQAKEAGVDCNYTPAKNQNVDIDVTIHICPGSGESCLAILEKKKGGDTIEITVGL